MALLLTACIAAACTSSSGARSTIGANPTIATELAPTTTTNPYAVPAVIDAAYVNRVLAGLDAIRGDALRIVMQTHSFPREAYDRLRAAYGVDNWLQLALDVLQNDMQRNFDGYSSVPGNEVTTVNELITAKSTCIFARVTRDYSAIGPGASKSSDRNWVVLQPYDPTRDPNTFNRTGWALSYQGFEVGRIPPKDPCVS